MSRHHCMHLGLHYLGLENVLAPRFMNPCSVHKLSWPDTAFCKLLCRHTFIHFLHQFADKWALVTGLPCSLEKMRKGLEIDNIFQDRGKVWNFDKFDMFVKKSWIWLEVKTMVASVSGCQLTKLYHNKYKFIYSLPPCGLFFCCCLFCSLDAVNNYGLEIKEVWSGKSLEFSFTDCVGTLSKYTASM